MKQVSLHDCDALSAALSLLQEKNDSVLLVPTETVYGLICDASSDSAKERIYQLKHRPANKLLAIFLPDLDSAGNFAVQIPPLAAAFAEKFCPGPLTLVIPDGKGGTFGFRIPDHPFVLALLRAYGKALASTSANLSGTPAALSTAEALATIDGEPDLTVDGGVIPANSLASTVVQILDDHTWKILRQGPVTEAQLQEAAASLER